jgi:hypothetical protein
MKKISLVIAALVMVFSLNASVIISGNPSAATVMVPLFNSGKTISLAKFMTLKPSEYKELTGKKMSFKERISLKLFQHRFKDDINADGTVNVKKLTDDEKDSGNPVGWFFLGFFFSVAGLVIALVIKDGHRHDRIKWALYGLGIGTALLILFLSLANKTFT